MQVEIVIKIHGKLWEAMQIRVHDIAGLADLCTIVSRSLVRALEQFRGDPTKQVVKRDYFPLWRSRHKEP